MSIATCPECDSELDFGNPSEPRIGDRLICSECDAELEVISTKPLTVDYFFDDDDDWDDDWDDE
jgi:alpha-aminoadipate carrier protein LysW